MGNLRRGETTPTRRAKRRESPPPSGGGKRAAIYRNSTLALALLLGASACADWKGGGGPQNWSSADQARWYGASQGSRFMPWDWAMALERPGEAGKFFDGAWLAAKFRLIPGGPYNISIGIARDIQPDDALTVTKLNWVAGQGNKAPWLGFNCSACHTAELRFNGHSERVDGGPGLTDFQSLVEAIEAALIETRAQPAKWDRFAKAVLGAKDSPAARTKLGGEVDKLLAWNARITAANITPMRPGFARLDAFGHIFNKVALLAGPDTPDPNPADAPVSYPFLWNTSQADKVQWNGIAENLKLKGFDYGALARNTGEVVGVYGDVAIHKGGGLGGYKSSVDVDNLNDLERQLAVLKPPAWPLAFGAIDETKRAAGEKLFVAQRCGSCHGKLDRDDVKTQFTTKVFTFTGTAFPGDEPPGTDPGMACNAFTYATRTGNMAGMPPSYLTIVNSKDPPLGDTAPVAVMLRTTVVGTLLGRKWEVIKAATKTWLGIPPAPVVSAVGVPETKAERLDRCLHTADKLLGYRARPLTGIWATAPYLHNGSVPTLFDLLRAPADRPKDFWVGTRDFDPGHVGYATAKSADNSFHFIAVEGGKPVDGNGNQGHDYGNASLTDAQRLEIVEYLKTL